MSRTLMRVEYHTSEFSTAVWGADRIRTWLAGQAKTAAGGASDRLQQAAETVRSLQEGDEPVSLMRDEALAIAETLKAAGTQPDRTVDETQNDTDAALREPAKLRDHARELGEAIARLAEPTNEHGFVHLQLV